MPAWCRERRAAELAVSVLVLRARAPAARPAARVVRARARPDWCNRHWARAQPVASYDPAIISTVGAEHQTTPLANQQIYGVPSLQSNTGQATITYSQAFPTGTSFTVEFNNSRQTTNSPFFNLSPVLNSMYRFSFQQQLLAGFGFGPNLRYLTIAKNNKKISDIAFKDQVIATITQIKNIYWDLVNAYEQARVNEQSLAFAQQSLDNAKKQLQLESVPAMDVMRAEAEVSKRDQDLTVARTSLQLQESLIKNALTKSLDDPVLEAVPVVPADRFETVETRDHGSSSGPHHPSIA